MAKNTLAIIGGGALGTMAVHDILKRYEYRLSKNAAIPSLTLAWYDAQGRFGETDAFSTSLPRSIRTNNPAYMIRPSAVTRNMFQDFCQAAYGGMKPEGYPPRRAYGEFLADLVPKLEANAKALGVTLHKIPAKVTDIIRHGTAAFRITNDAGRTHQAGGVLVAIGPAANPALEPLRGLPGFIEHPASREDYLRTQIDLKNPNTTVIGFGPGNSFFDSLVLLERELGFKGRYILLQPHQRSPWAVMREKEIPDNNYYNFRHFKYDNLPCPVTLEILQSTLQRDIDALGPVETNPLRYGIEHPLYYIAAFAMNLFQSWAAHHNPEPALRDSGLAAFTALQRQALDAMKDVTSPDSIRLFNKVYDAGRIETINGRLLTDKIRHNGQGLSLLVALKENGVLTLRGDALINGMPHQGDWRQVKDGLLTRMRQRNLIRLQDNGTVGLYDFNHALKNGIGLAGAAVDSVWGLHILANKLGVACDMLVEQMTEPRPPATKLRAPAVR